MKKAPSPVPPPRENFGGRMGRCSIRLEPSYRRGVCPHTAIKMRERLQAESSRSLECSGNLSPKVFERRGLGGGKPFAKGFPPPGERTVKGSAGEGRLLKKAPSPVPLPRENFGGRMGRDLIRLESSYWLIASPGSLDLAGKGWGLAILQ